MTDRYANGDPANDRGGRRRPRDVTGFDPADTGWFHGGDLRGLTGDCTDPQRGLARLKRPRLHRDLGHAAVRPEAPCRAQRRLPRLLDPRLHDRRPAPRHRGRLRRVRRLRAPARAEGLPRRRRQPHRRRDPAAGSSYGPDEPTALPGAVHPRYGAKPRPTMPREPPAATAKTPAWLNDAPATTTAATSTSTRAASLLRAGRLLRARRPVHRAGRTCARARDVYADWIRATRSTASASTPPARRPRLLPALGPRILAARASGRVPDFQLFGEVFVTDAVELSAYVRDRGLPNVLDFPLQDALARFAGGERGRAGSPRGSTTTTTSSAPSGGRAHAADVPRQPRHGPRGAADPVARGRRGAAGAPRRVAARATTCSTSCAARRSSTTATRSGSSARAATRRRGTISSRRRSRSGGRRSASARRRSAPARPSTSTAHPVGERLKALGALRAGASRARDRRDRRARSRARLLAVSRIDAAARREYLALVNAGTARPR